MVKNRLDMVLMRPFRIQGKGSDGLEYRYHYRLASYDRNGIFLQVTAIDYTTSMGDWRNNDTPCLIAAWAAERIKNHFQELMLNYCGQKISFFQLQVMISCDEEE